jgi:hypothetical protein
VWECVIVCGSVVSVVSVVCGSVGEWFMEGVKNFSEI